MEKCSGHGCIHRYRCLHHSESKKKTKVKGRWIDSERCVQSEWDEDEIVKVPFDRLLLKGDSDE